jgi:hypothetical protein
MVPGGLCNRYHGSNVMKVLYEAVDGYSVIKEMTEAQLRGQLRFHEVGIYQAVSFDGVSKLIPHDTETEAVFTKIWREQNL